MTQQEFVKHFGNGALGILCEKAGVSMVAVRSYFQGKNVRVNTRRAIISALESLEIERKDLMERELNINKNMKL